MNDNPVYNITKEQVLAMAKECPTAEKILRAGFPDAFEDEWEDVTHLAKVRADRSPGLGVFIDDGKQRSNYWDLSPSVRFTWDGNEIAFPRESFKIEGGKIWRKRK